MDANGHGQTPERAAHTSRSGAPGPITLPAATYGTDGEISRSAIESTSAGQRRTNGDGDDSGRREADGRLVTSAGSVARRLGALSDGRAVVTQADNRRAAAINTLIPAIVERINAANVRHRWVNSYRRCRS